MAVVYKKPDALSLSGNLKTFEVTSGSNVRFKLLKGATILIDHSYEPGADNRIVIDVKLIVESNLEFTLLAGETSYTQTKLVADFVAEIDGTRYPFKAIRTGVSNLTDTPANWLKYHFLTWQPAQKKVTYYSPEWLTYYATVAGSIRIHAYFEDGTDSGKVLQACSVGNAYTVNLQYAVVAGMFSNKLPMYYDVYFVNTSGIQLSETQRYLADSPVSEDETWISWENSLGGFDTARVSGTNTFDAGHTHNIATVDDISFEYQVDTERKYSKNTGFLNNYERRWLLDFFPAKTKYIHTSETLRRIVVTEDNVTYKSNDLPSSYTFKYKFAESGSFLNLQKQNNLPSGITIPVPSLPDFTLPPRLIEYLRVPLSEGVLFPVQDPNSDFLGVATLGALKNYIILGLDEPGSGLSFVETLKEWSKSQFISKVKSDTAKEIISFAKGISIGSVFIREVNGILTFSESITSEKSVSAWGASQSSIPGSLNSLGDLVDVDDTGKKNGSILLFNGTHWIVEDGSNISPDLTGYATQIYVDDRISTIIAGAPAAFDTLKEIADVLQGNVSSIGDILTALGTKWTQDNTLIASWNAAYSDKHTHTNKAVLDGITSALIGNWNAAFNWGDHAKAGYLKTSDFATYFKKDSNGRIYTDLDFYSTKSVSAYGPGLNGGGSGSVVITSADAYHALPVKQENTLYACLDKEQGVITKAYIGIYPFLISGGLEQNKAFTYTLPLILK